MKSNCYAMQRIHEGSDKLKRLIASRKLNRKCVYCNKNFRKGNVYYKLREVYTDYKVKAFESIVCPKCNYKNENHKKRFELFKEKCIHPLDFVETEWSYITGECVKEPNYDYCRLCGKILD